jgi:hypothetical protein
LIASHELLSSALILMRFSDLEQKMASKGTRNWHGWRATFGHCLIEKKEDLTMPGI